MNIEQIEISVRELVNGYSDNGDQGVVGYGGLLDIRPPYQREFIYNDEQRNAVIDTINKGFPLNVMYWAVRDDGGYEIIDGQQRTISICQYVNGDFSIDGLHFHNLRRPADEKILNYKLMIYKCKGTDADKLKWFETINIAGEELTKQELKNAVYHGSWVTDAKRYFSKNECAAYQLGGRYLLGTAIRQDYLETAIDWISNGQIQIYMAKNQHKENAKELTGYFDDVIFWVNALFPNYRREMKGVNWGKLYNRHSTHDPTIRDLFPTIPSVIENIIEVLMLDDDVVNKRGIYYYLFDRHERHLNLRSFTDSQKRIAYERQGGICGICRETFAIEETEADHITPWSQGGKTNTDNLQLLCRECNRRKSDN